MDSTDDSTSLDPPEGFVSFVEWNPHSPVRFDDPDTNNETVADVVSNLMEAELIVIDSDSDDSVESVPSVSSVSVVSVSSNSPAAPDLTEVRSSTSTPSPPIAQPSTSSGITSTRDTFETRQNIAEFRQVIGADGEITWLFASDVENSDDEDSEDDDYLPFAAATSSSTTQTSNRRSRLRNSSNRFSLNSLLETSTSTSGVAPSTSASTSARRGRESETRNTTRSPRRRRKQARKSRQVKKKAPSSPQPLPPKTVRRLVSVYSSEEETMFESLKSSRPGGISRCNINCSWNDKIQDYFIGCLDLQIVEPETVKLPSFTMQTVSTIINGIKNMTLHISDEENKSLLCIQVEEELTDSQCEQIKLSSALSAKEMRRKYIYINTKNLYFLVNLCGVSAQTMKGLGLKTLFRLEISTYDEATKLLSLRATILNSGIYLQHEVGPNASPKRAVIAEVVQHFFQIDKVEAYAQEQTLMEGKEDIAWFYGQIKKYHRQEVLPDLPLESEGSLIPILRNYQKDAVKWMLCRERGLIDKINLTDMFLNKMFLPIELISKLYTINDDDSVDQMEPETKTVYYSPHFGTFAWNIPCLGEMPSGGILCDEMGLGKTVEVLSLVTLNQRKILINAKEDIGENSLLVESKDEIVNSEDEFGEVVASKYRKKRKGRGRKKKNVKPAISAKREEPSTSGTTSTNTTATRRTFLSPVKRKRNVSPCEFETQTPETPSEVPAPIKEPNLAQASQDHGKIKKKRKSTDTDTKEPTKLYDKVKSLYDNALSQFRTSSELTKRFKGEFFNPHIAPKMCFQCICGEGIEDSVKYPITCTICSCSQHAECVGFEPGRSEEFYVCPHCTISQMPKEIKATLIVTPSTISQQWIQEIQKHVKNANLKILFYKGVSEQGYIPPSTLGQYDVIITTYNVLAVELNYVDIPHESTGGRQFRNPKRYLPIPSPLLSVNFWRICLDEAQMVEGSTTKTAAMASRLNSVHRWCVTGTPMNKGLEDLFGLFSFLQLEPVNFEFWWNTFVSKAFYEKNNTETLFEIFGQLVWRTCKSDVLHQLGIPPQTEILHWQTFSPLETHFYQRQFEVCSEKILEKVNDRKFNPEGEESILHKRLAQLDRGTLNALLQPFLMLRQACVHPQMVKGNWISLNKAKGTLTMEDLLDQLIKKSSVQCAEDNRVAISSLNAMAGLYLIRENYAEAVKSYREVLQREAKYRDTFKTDPLQLIHTLENLADVLDRNHAGVGFTLRDDALRGEANELKQKYLESYASEVKISRNVIAPVTSTVEKLEAILASSTKSESWWVATLNRAARLNMDSTLIHRIKDDLTMKSKKKQIGSIIHQFSDLNGLQNLLVGKIMEIEALRDSVLQSLTGLEKLDPHSLVSSAVSCHLRKQLGPNSEYYNDSASGYKCTLCSYHDQFLQLESVLFAEEKTDAIVRTGRNYQKFKLGGRTVDQLSAEELDLVLLQEQEELAESTEHAALKTILRHGTWGPSETERVLKIVHSSSKLYGMNVRIIEDGSNHIKLLDAAKKEFKLNRILWRRIYDQVSALDELDQATTRLRLAIPGEMKKPDQQQQPSTSTSTNRRKAKVPTSLHNQLRYNQESDEKIQTIHILKPHEIEPKMHQAQMEFTESEHQLAIHLGQVMYLDTLKKSGYGKKGTTNSDDCPICTSQLGYKWCVLVCGHSFCSECVKKMCPNPAHSIQCPICRMTMKYAEISFVDTKIEESIEETSKTDEPQPSTSKGISSGINFSNVPLAREVVGSHSSKVGQVVETLMKLETTHPGEKVIIFSSWVEVLEIIGRALEQNDIRYNLIVSGKKFQKSLEAFKTKQGIQALLMPLTSGSKGLNIIEATHVFLVEPTLNLATELQAIGRVHRIGQTKPTFVHRFYVKETIEEQLYNILRTQDISSDDEGSLTVADLKNLVSKRR